MVNATDSTPNDEAASEQLSARPAQLPTHPDEVANLPAPHIVPDGVSAPIRHPLDPLNAGKHPDEPIGSRGQDHQDMSAVRSTNATRYITCTSPCFR